jgi:hypothetical protein
MVPNSNDIFDSKAIIAFEMYDEDIDYDEWFEYWIKFGDGSKYDFPFYLISFINQSLESAVIESEDGKDEITDYKNLYIERFSININDQDQEANWGNGEWELVRNPTGGADHFTLGGVGLLYRFHFYLTGEHERVRHTIYLGTEKINYAPKFNNINLRAHVEEFLHREAREGVVYSEEGITLPNLKPNGVFSAEFFHFSYNEDYRDEYKDDADENFNSYGNINTIRNVRLGYKMPGSSDDFRYTTSFSLTASSTIALTEGWWIFCYQIEDFAGNRSSSFSFLGEHSFTFELYVIDNSPPTISLSNERIEAFVDEIFFFSMPSITDRGGAGLNNNATKVTMYKGMRGSGDDNPDNIVPLSRNNQFFFTEADKSPNPRSVYTYYIKIEAEDILGNRATPRYAYIYVIDRVVHDPDPEPRPTNTLFYLLLAFAGILVLFIVVMIFWPEPKEGEKVNETAGEAPKPKKLKENIAEAELTDEAATEEASPAKPDKPKSDKKKK